LGLDVKVYDPYVAAETMEAAGVGPTDWESLLRTSDYISLHASLTDETRRIVDARALSLMKPTAFLINTGRGALIDEEALLGAIRAGQIAGAALDVLTVEPPLPDHPLLREERVWITPHLACYSDEADLDVRVRAAEEVVRVLRGEKPRSPVNQIH
jgi:D-3-phosphoglycerate dehydrogenase